MTRKPLALLAACLLGLSLTSISAADPGSERRPLSFVDLMQFRTLVDPVISDDGSWIAYELRPDRGDGAVEVRAAEGSKRHSLERGQSVALTPDGAWAAALIVPPLEEQESAEEGDDPLPNGLALLRTSDGEQSAFERVESFAFSKDGQWLIVHHGQDEPAEEPEADETASEPNSENAEANENAEAEEEDEKEERLGTRLRLRHLPSGEELEIEHVESAALAETSDYLAYAVAAPEGENGLFVIDLKNGLPSLDRAATIASVEGGRYTALAWSETAAHLGFVAAKDDEQGEAGPGSLWLWDGEAKAISEPDDERHVPSVNTLTWSDDGERLYFGLKPRQAQKEHDSDESDGEQPFDPYDVEAILDGVELDVWHVDDPLIKTNERQQWEEEKDRSYLAVYHLKSSKVVPLADENVRVVEPHQSTRGTFGTADVPYLKERTWDGFYEDLYWISLESGQKHKVSARNGEPTPKLSPDGRQLAWYEDRHWYLYDADTGTRRNLTEGLDVSFADEDHDYPADVGGYDAAGFLADGSGVVVYDKYDIWLLPSDPGAEARNLTEGIGRSEQTQLRLWDLDEDSDFVPTEGPWLVEGYRDQAKNDGLWLLSRAPKSGSSALTAVHEAEKRFDLKAVSEDGQKLLFTQESYREFPDLWIADSGFENRRKLTTANPQIADFSWGEAELVEWKSLDGIPLQGVLIRPEHMADDERCPVLIYYYRFFSQRLHQFNDPKVNHRPSFPVYASHGYCVFLPDVRFEIGRPGMSAVKAVVPGVQKLVEMGVADPDALGLHGHSWSGYQTAYVVTQTNIFAAAVAGAPVSNMTSAYGGIRYGTGLARQFQYEKTQSRLGKSLWEGRHLYIDNSPLFLADRIETPLLIQFGDVDEAVPWTQGVELYLAMRRLGKESVFLQYRDEPHHLKKYPNKLDYAIKMKQYFDHYLKGEPAAAWITEGVPFEGE